MRVFSIAMMIIVSVGAIFVFAVKKGCSTPPYRTVWQAGDGVKIPDHFCYLLLPKAGRVEMLNTDSSPTGKFLSRAVVCSHAELQSKSVGVWEGSEELRVPVEFLVFTLDATNRDRSISAWKETVKSWGRDNDWPLVDVSFEDVGDKTVRVQLRRTNRRGDETVFFYSVRDGAAHPEKELLRRMQLDF